MTALPATQEFPAPDATQPFPASGRLSQSQGRRTEHVGWCTCATEGERASLPDNWAETAQMAISMINAGVYLDRYAQLLAEHAPSLSMRQTVGDLINLEKKLDAIREHVSRMRNDMPLVAPRGGVSQLISRNLKGAKQ